MVSVCLVILWSLIVIMLMPNRQTAGLIVSVIGAVLINIICVELGIK